MKRWPRIGRDLGVVLSIAGWGFGVATWMVANPTGISVGIDLASYLRAGNDLLAGRGVYVGQIGDAANFPYAPTWAVLFAALTWIPGTLLQAAVIALDLAAIRYLTGSWKAAGWLMWLPLVVMLIDAGNIDLLIAASIVLAWRGRPEALVLGGLAKLGPFLAIPLREWRKVVIALAVCFAITIPWLYLWPEWIAYLLRQPTVIPISLFAVPWYFRLPIALVLVASRRPWLAALAVVVAMPSMYLSTLLILLAPVRLYLDSRSETTKPGQAAPAPALNRLPSGSTA